MSFGSGHGNKNTNNIFKEKYNDYIPPPKVDDSREKEDFIKYKWINTYNRSYQYQVNYRQVDSHLPKHKRIL